MMTTTFPSLENFKITKITLENETLNWQEM